MLSGLVCVRKCMWVKHTQTKAGFPAEFWRLMNSTARVAMSSSIVSIRFLVSGPVSLMVCLPTLPKRGSTVGSSTAVALHSSTPRGPNLAINVGVLRVVRQFRLFGCVQVIERAVELVEPMNGRQEFIPVAEVVLAELAGGVALGLEQLGDGHVAGLESLGGAGHADCGIAGAQAALPGDE